MERILAVGEMTKRFFAKGARLTLPEGINMRNSLAAAALACSFSGILTVGTLDVMLARHFMPHSDLSSSNNQVEVPPIQKLATDLGITLSVATPPEEAAHPATNEYEAQAAAPQEQYIIIDPAKIGVPKEAPAPVTKAVSHASQKTGVDVGLLMAMAWVESKFDVKAESDTSSAKGLYQFTAQQWQETMMKFGDRHGQGKLAQHLRSEKEHKAEPESKHAKAVKQAHKEQITKGMLRLRNNPDLAAALTAEQLKDNATRLTALIKRDPNDVEIYLTHFVGVTGAAKMVHAMEHNPNMSVTALFKKGTLNANEGIFKNGKAYVDVATAYQRIHSALDPAIKYYSKLYGGKEHNVVIASSASSPAPGPKIK
jgi:hypothetical protein